MTFRVEDEVLAPYNVITLNYTGVNPFEIYKRIGTLLQLIFQIKGKDIIEYDFRWNITEDPRGFYIKIWAEKRFDKFTKLFVYVKLEGAQPTDPNKIGKLKIELSGRLASIFPSETVIQRIFLEPLLWMYYRFFYKDVRRRHLEVSKRYTLKLESELRALLKLEQRISV